MDAIKNLSQRNQKLAGMFKRNLLKTVVGVCIFLRYGILDSVFWFQFTHQPFPNPSSDDVSRLTMKLSSDLCQRRTNGRTLQRQQRYDRSKGSKLRLIL